MYILLVYSSFIAFDFCGVCIYCTYQGTSEVACTYSVPLWLYLCLQRRNTPVDREKCQALDLAASLQIFMTTLSCLTCVLLDSYNGKLLSVYKDVGCKSSHTVISMLDRQQQVRVLDKLQALAHVNVWTRKKCFQQRLHLDGLLASGNVFMSLFKLCNVV